MSYLDLEDTKEAGFSVLPQASYNVVVDEVSIKPTKAGTGEYVNMKLKVIAGEYEGRSIFTTFVT